MAIMELMKLAAKVLKLVLALTNPEVDPSDCNSASDCQKSHTHLQVPEVRCVEFCGRGDIQVRRVFASRWTQR
jgi:hypothetical protein